VPEKGSSGNFVGIKTEEDQRQQDYGAYNGLNGNEFESVLRAKDNVTELRTVGHGQHSNPLDKMDSLLYTLHL